MSCFKEGAVYQFISKWGVRGALLLSIWIYSMGAMAAMPGKLSMVVEAHPPVTGDCVTCHPDSDRTKSK